MLTNLAIAFALMSLCVAVQAMGMIRIAGFLRTVGVHGSAFWSSVWILVRVATCTILLHLAQVLAWACAYAGGGAMPDLATASYFSGVTYTTTGYGDLVLPSEWRLVGAMEALTGILMCGLSTGMFFAVFSRLLTLRQSAPVETLTLIETSQ